PHRLRHCTRRGRTPQGQEPATRSKISSSSAPLVFRVLTIDATAAKRYWPGSVSRLAKGRSGRGRRVQVDGQETLGPYAGVVHVVEIHEIGASVSVEIGDHELEASIVCREGLGRAEGTVTVAAKDLDPPDAKVVFGQHGDVEVAVAVEVRNRQEGGLAERGVSRHEQGVCDKVNPRLNLLRRPDREHGEAVIARRDDLGNPIVVEVSRGLDVDALRER